MVPLLFTRFSRTEPLQVHPKQYPAPSIPCRCNRRRLSQPCPRYPGGSVRCSEAIFHPYPPAPSQPAAAAACCPPGEPLCKAFPDVLSSSLLFCILFLKAGDLFFRFFFFLRWIVSYYFLYKYCFNSVSFGFNNCDI